MSTDRDDHPLAPPPGGHSVPAEDGRGKVIDGDGDMRVLDGTKMERAATPPS